MSEKHSLLNRSSRYVSGGQTEATSKFLEWWERAKIEDADDDIAYVVEKKFVGRRCACS